MKWRPAEAADTEQILRLHRRPMPGKVSLVWGLTELTAPPGCSNLRVFVVEEAGEVFATAMTWDWLNGDRYLAGLRFSEGMSSRPGRRMWTRGYREVLDGVDFAWTSVGRDNAPARRLLERGASWLPVYTPRLQVRSWFRPLRRGKGRTPDEELQARGLTPLSHRLMILHSGGRLARFARVLGCLPPAGEPLRLLYAPQSVPTRDLRGFDGLIRVFPADQAPRTPPGCGVWDSILYQVHWNPACAPASIPAFEGAWL